MSESATSATAQLSARHLSRDFTSRVPGRFMNAKRVTHAVEDVTLDLLQGRVTAVVGESGSGKSVLARMLARIVKPTSGELLVEGTPEEIRSNATVQEAYLGGVHVPGEHAL